MLQLIIEIDQSTGQFLSALSSSHKKKTLPLSIFILKITLNENSKTNRR